MYKFIWRLNASENEIIMDIKFGTKHYQSSLWRHWYSRKVIWFYFPFVLYLVSGVLCSYAHAHGVICQTEVSPACCSSSAIRDLAVAGALWKNCA